MALFASKKQEEYRKLIEKNNTIIEKQANTLNELEDMIAREKNNGLNFSSIQTLYEKFGDPYINDVTTRRCIDEIAKNIAAVPIEILNTKGELVSESDKVVKLFNYINDEDSTVDFIYEIVRSLQRYGKTFIYLNMATEKSLPVQLDVLDTSKMKAIVNNGKLVHWKYNGKQIFQPYEILFIRYRHPTDPYDGLAPLSSLIKEVVLTNASLIYNIKYFENGATGRGVWVDPSGQPLTPAQKREADYAVEQEWNRGLDGAHKTPVLTRKLEWIRTSDSSKDMDFLNLLSTMSNRIMDTFGVPQVILHATEATFSNLRDGKKMFWTQTLLPIMELISSTITSSFLAKREIPYTFRFKKEDIPELQTDLSEKLDNANKLYSMNVPLSVISEVVDIQLGDGWEGWDKPPSSPSIYGQMSEKPDYTKIVDSYVKQSRYEEEKSINTDSYIKAVEYKKSLGTMLEIEKDISNTVEAFFREKYKEIEKWLELNPPIEEKSLSVEWMSKLKNFIMKFDWGQEFVYSLKSVLEYAFNRGRYRTYWGVGVSFQQASQSTLDFIMKRGLKLAGAPRVVQETLIKHLSSEAFSINDIAKEISSKWKDASLARAKNIAITESTAAYNGGRVEAMKELGIKKKQWVHSHDGKVRDSHRISSIVPVNEKFVLADGYTVDYPGDGDPEHACNCRCVAVSYLE